MHPISYCHSTSSRNSRNGKTWSSAHQQSESGFAGSMQHRVRSKDNELQLINTTSNYPVFWEHFPTEQLRQARLRLPSASTPDEQKPTFNENDSPKALQYHSHLRRKDRCCRRNAGYRSTCQTTSSLILTPVSTSNRHPQVGQKYIPASQRDKLSKKTKSGLLHGIDETQFQSNSQPQCQPFRCPFHTPKNA